MIRKRKLRRVRLLIDIAVIVGSTVAAPPVVSRTTSPAPEQSATRALRRLPSQHATDDYILSHVNVIDTRGGPTKTDMSVEVRGSRIVSVAPTLRHHARRTVKTIDATGKFLMPGLWDMHVHTGERDTYLPLYIANGVTGVRDMGGDLEEPTGYSSTRFVQLRLWRAAIEHGRLTGPRMVLAGFLI